MDRFVGVNDASCCIWVIILKISKIKSSSQRFGLVHPSYMLSLAELKKVYNRRRS